jgi:hypothetical protein
MNNKTNDNIKKFFNNSKILKENLLKIDDFMDVLESSDLPTEKEKDNLLYIDSIKVKDDKNLSFLDANCIEDQMGDTSSNQENEEDSKNSGEDEDIELSADFKFLQQSNLFFLKNHTSFKKN